MKIVLSIAILIVLIAIPTYPHWSYKAWYDKKEREYKAMHAGEEKHE